MFLLVSGASGAGKSTARRLVAGELEPAVECVELHDVVPMPRAPTLAWRQRATEAVVCHALKLKEDGRHVLLAGDPVAAGEVLAARSADRLDGIAVCLLDVTRELRQPGWWRGGDPTLLVHHVGFADWMREHAANPRHRLEVLQTDGCEQMRWERLSRLDETGSWAMHVIDTSSLTTAAAVAAELLAWCRRALAGQAPSMRARP